MSDIVERLREQAELVPVVPRAPWKAMAEAADEITRLRAQVAALEGDAGRYRWLREHSGEFQGPEIFVNGKYELGSNLDAAIDSALKTATATP